MRSSMFSTKSLHSRNSHVDHSILIRGSTQVRRVALYWSIEMSISHVRNWSRGIRFGMFELGLRYFIWSLFHCFIVSDHDYEFRNIIWQHFNNLLRLLKISYPMLSLLSLSVEQLSLYWRWMTGARDWKETSALTCRIPYSIPICRNVMVA